MYKHYDFAKIYEAEQTGTPLNPEDMGMESVDNSTAPKLEDFEALKNKGYQIEIMLTGSDITNLHEHKTIIKNDAKWKNRTNQTADIVDIASLIINIGDEPLSAEEEAIIFKIDAATADEIYDNLQGGGTVTNALNSFKPIINGLTVNFIKSNDINTDDQPNVQPASDEQIAAGAVTPEPTEGVIAETKSIMNFNQFVSESMKGNWLADAVKGLDKGALKKDLKVKEGEKVTKSKIAKKEAELKKKDKDKKKPGLQLNPKDAKTHKRNILAKNLLNAVSENEDGQGESSRAGNTRAGIGSFKDILRLDITKPYHFGKDKMKTGSDDVDTNTSEYKGLVDKLKNSLIDPTIKSGTPLTVVGGASKVGSSSGYDNDALAKRRADKFIAKLKMSVPGIEQKYKISSVIKVGTETKKDSPKAYAEQFVHLSFTEPSSAISMASYEVDNTVAYNAKIYPPIKKDGGVTPVNKKMKRVCVQIPESYVDAYIAMINAFKKENSLSELKYGTYDIK